MQPKTADWFFLGIEDICDSEQSAETNETKVFAGSHRQHTEDFSEQFDHKFQETNSLDVCLELLKNTLRIFEVWGVRYYRWADKICQKHQNPSQTESQSA